MGNLMTDFNPKTPSVEQDFVHEFDLSANDYDLAKGPTCGRKGYKNTTALTLCWFVSIEEIASESVHPDFYFLNQEPDPQYNEEDLDDSLFLCGDYKDGFEGEFNDRYMQMYKNIPEFADVAIMPAQLVLNSSKPPSGFICESYFIFEADAHAPDEDLDVFPAFEGWARYSKVRYA